jgi:hypothetical protein
MDVTVHTVRNFSMCDRDAPYEMQRKLIIVLIDTVQVFSFTLRAAELCPQQFNIQ